MSRATFTVWTGRTGFRDRAALPALTLAVALGWLAFAAPVASADTGSYQMVLSGTQMCAAGSRLTDGPSTGLSEACDLNQADGVVEAQLNAAPGASHDSSVSFQVDSPSNALTITNVKADGQFANGDSDFVGGSYWNDGSHHWIYGSSGPYLDEQLPNSLFWGVQLVCAAPGDCDTTGESSPALILTDMTLTVAEALTPSVTYPDVTPTTSANLLDQTGWVWNSPSNPWTLTMSGTDPSGVCSQTLSVNGTVGASQTQTADETAWQQCPNDWQVSDVLDTSALLPGTSGTITIDTTAQNAAGVVADQDFKPRVDNVKPSVSFTELNDNDLTGAGNNAIAQLQITPSTGPSGLASMLCTLDGQPVTPSPDPNLAGSYVLSVDDSVSHQVLCTAYNTAIDPQGQVNSGGSSFTVPAYTSSAVSFQKLANPLVKTTVKKRVLVGYRYVTRVRRGKKLRVRVARYVTKRVLRYVERCTDQTVNGVMKKVCVEPTTVYQDALIVPHGKSTTIFGQLSSGDDANLADQTVTLVGVPTNGSTTQTTIGTATTNATGGWSAVIAAGESQTITAVYAGDGTQLPAQATASITVPAQITLTATPTELAWSGIVTLTGQLQGGYIPRDGVAMRLLIDLPGQKQPYDPSPFRTNSAGAFTLRFSWHAGRGTVTYPMYVATTGNESDYPFSYANSPKVRVTFTSVKR